MITGKVIVNYFDNQIVDESDKVICRGSDLYEQSSDALLEFIAQAINEKILSDQIKKQLPDTGMQILVIGEDVELEITRRLSAVAQAQEAILSSQKLIASIDHLGKSKKSKGKNRGHNTHYSKRK